MMKVALPQGEVSPDWPSYNCGHAAAIWGVTCLRSLVWVYFVTRWNEHCIQTSDLCLSFPAIVEYSSLKPLSEDC